MGEYVFPSSMASPLNSGISHIQKETSSPSPETPVPFTAGGGGDLWASGAGFACSNSLPNNKHYFLICPCVSVVFFFLLKASSPQVVFLELSTCYHLPSSVLRKNIRSASLCCPPALHWQAGHLSMGFVPSAPTHTWWQLDKAVALPVPLRSYCAKALVSSALWA